MQSQQMQNPISKLQRKHFLKKPSTQKDHSSMHLNPLNHRARTIKQRQLSSHKTNKDALATKEVAIETNQNYYSWNQQLNELKMDKQELSRQLAMKQSQILQLKLKHIELKEKYDYLQKNNLNRKQNSYDFGDISNISVENTAPTKNFKSQELTNLKQRLQNIKLDKLLKSTESSMVKSKVLPIEI